MNQNNLEVAAERCRPQNRHGTANPIGTLAVVTLIGFNRAGRLRLNPLRIFRRGNVSGSPNCGVAILSDFILADDEINFLMPEKNRRHTITIPVDVDDLAGFSQAVYR